MSITQEQIKKITKNLAKLPSNSDKIEHDLNSIIWYIDILNEIDTTWVIPTISVTKSKSTLRDDVESSDLATPTELLKCSSNKIIAGQIAVWSIMK